MKNIYTHEEKKHVLSSLIKRPPLLLHSCAFHSKSEMVWYFIGVYTINKILYGCLRIKNLSSHVEKLCFMSQCNQHSESETLCIFLWPCNTNIVSDDKIQS